MAHPFQSVIGIGVRACVIIHSVDGFTHLI